MKRFLGAGAVLTAICGVTAAHASEPVQMEPHVGIVFKKQFGGEKASLSQLGFTLNYSNTYELAQSFAQRSNRPAMMDLSFKAGGLSALNLYGMNALKPTLALHEGESEGGFFSNITSSIDWGVVSVAVAGGGLYYLAQEERDDRKEEAAQAPAAGSSSAGGGSGSGSSSPIPATGTPLDGLTSAIPTTPPSGLPSGSGGIPATGTPLDGVTGALPLP